MRLAIHTTDGGTLDIADFDGPSFMTMLEYWEAADLLAFTLDTGMAYIAKTAIVRIDTFDT